MKKRLDELLVERGLAESRSQAASLIREGKVRVEGRHSPKPGNQYPVDVAIEVEEASRFVSRGGWKLEGAFSHFGFSVEGLDCLDVGASTGGFTDCLLQHGAARVASVDVGHDQLHPRMRADSRVWVREGFNARAMPPEDLPFVTKKFYRGKNVGDMPGSGLGLYIVDYILKAMNIHNHSYYR